MKIPAPRFSFLMLAVLWSVSVGLTAAVRADDAADPAFKAWRQATTVAESERRYGDMILLAQGWTQQHPDSALGYVFEGQAYYTLGDFENARVAFAKEQKLSPQFNESETWLSYMQQIEEKYGSLPPLVPTESDNVQRARIWSSKFSQMLEAKHYDELDKTALALTKSQSCGADGQWDLFLFVSALDVSASASSAEAEWKANMTKVKAWNKARPQSTLAKIVLAEMLVSGAWIARGEDITVEHPNLYMERLEAVVPFFKALSAPSKVPKSPLFYDCFLDWALLSGIPKADYEKVFHEAIALYPACTDLYITRAHYLLPRWHGRDGEWEQFVKNSADKIGGEAGDILYARVVWYLFDFLKYENLLKQSKPSWPRVRRGLQAILKKNPNSISTATRLFGISLQQNPPDLATALDVLQKQIGGKVDLSLYASVGYFAANRMYVLESTLTQPVASVNSFAPGGQGEAHLEAEKNIHVVAQTPSDTMSWWTADGNADDSLKRNNARLYGSVSYVPGMVGQAFRLDGNKSYIKVSTSDLNPGPGAGFTVEMWIKADDLKQRRPIAGWSATTTPGVSLWLEPAEGDMARIGADLRDKSGGAHRILSEKPVIVAGKWQHIALDYRKDRGVVALFCDGQLVRERNVGEIEAQTSLDFYVGKHIYIEGGNTTFKGLIDEVSVFSRGLGQAEIQGFYEAGSAGKQIVAERDPILSGEQRWQARNQRLASLSLKHGGKAMSFAAKIDGSDFVHIQGDKVWYVHRSWDPPGRQGGGNEPTFVNGVEWFPAWDGNTSDKFTLPLALPTTGEPVLNIDVLKQGGDTNPVGVGTQVTITQDPTAENGYETILFLNDDTDGGSHWFILNIAWDEAPATTK